MSCFSRHTRELLTTSPEYVFLNIIGPDSIRPHSYAELSMRIYDYCFCYEEKKLVPGDTVLIVLKESLDLFASFFAGIIYGVFPAYYAYPSPKQPAESFLQSIEHLSSYNEIRLLVCFDEVITLLSGAHLPLLDRNEVVSLGKDCWWDFVRGAEESFLQFSSGTTGMKKGVKICSRALFRQIESYECFVGFREGSRVASWLPHYHDMGLIACMLMPFLRRVPIFMMSPFEWVKRPEMLLEVITKNRCTHAWLPNFALGHLTRRVLERDLEKYDLSSVSNLTCCSEPLLFDTYRQFVDKFAMCGLRHGVVGNCYAMAENTFAVSATRCRGVDFLPIDYPEMLKSQKIVVREGGYKIASAGSLLANANLRIVGCGGVELGEDEVGEIWIKSSCLFDSYYKNDRETESSFEDQWFKTGDLGFFHQGELFVTGRLKDMIIVGGENIYPQDIESILNEEKDLIPGRNLAFGAIDQAIGTERIVVLAESYKKKDEIDVLAIKKKIFDSLNVSVSGFVVLPHMSLKKGTAGKISRYLNKKEYENGLFRNN